MIDRIEIENFQCHKSLMVDLAPITVFVGGNDIGKSAVMRAFKWWALNEWDGKAGEHITWGEEFSRVSIWKSGIEIARIKGKGINDYRIGEGADESFMAGTSVPDPIARIINLTEANFQDQHDVAFWMTLTGAKAATALNEIFQLSSIDDSLDFNAKEIRHSKAKLKVIEERILEAEVTKESFQWTVEANEVLKEAEDAMELWESVEREVDRLGKAIKDLKIAEKKASRSEVLIKAAKDALDIGNKCIVLAIEIKQIESILELEAELCQKIKSLKEKQKKLKTSLKVCPLCQRQDP